MSLQEQREYMAQYAQRTLSQTALPRKSSLDDGECCETCFLSESDFGFVVCDIRLMCRKLCLISMFACPYRVISLL